MLKLNRSKALHKKLVQNVFSDPKGRAAYEAFALQFELAAKMKKAREKAHLTQEDIAKKMGTKKPAISRLEGNVFSRKIHSPSLNTLIKYANAIGKQLKIDFVDIQKKAI